VKVAWSVVHFTREKTPFESGEATVSATAGLPVLSKGVFMNCTSWAPDRK
jgi:hypothetical protein